jgi:outer membrane murein-binding lipoprotein Lpp
MKLTKTQLREIIKEVLLTEINYAPLPVHYANKLRAMKGGVSLDKKVGKTGLSVSKRNEIRNKIGNLETKLENLRVQFADLNFEMEQTAEPAGGRVANRIATDMEKLLDKIDKTEKQINELRRKLI